MSPVPQGAGTLETSLTPLRALILIFPELLKTELLGFP